MIITDDICLTAASASGDQLFMLQDREINFVFETRLLNPYRVYLLLSIYSTSSFIAQCASIAEFDPSIK
jgi:hypothetical protein